jgi:hypothetical protein
MGQKAKKNEIIKAKNTTDAREIRKYVFYDGAHEGEYISTVQMCIYDWTSYLVLNRMNAVLSSLHLDVDAVALVPWAGWQEAGGRGRAESSCWRPGCSLWCCCDVVCT